MDAKPHSRGVWTPNRLGKSESTLRDDQRATGYPCASPDRDRESSMMRRRLANVGEERRQVVKRIQGDFVLFEDGLGRLALLSLIDAKFCYDDEAKFPKHWMIVVRQERTFHSPNTGPIKDSGRCRVLKLDRLDKVESPVLIAKLRFD